MGVIVVVLCAAVVVSAALPVPFRATDLLYVIILEEPSWLTCMVCSDSPLNAEAAELWGNDPEEFKRKVLARHRDIDDD